MLLILRHSEGLPLIICMSKWKWIYITAHNSPHYCKHYYIKWFQRSSQDSFHRWKRPHHTTSYESKPFYKFHKELFHIIHFLQSASKKVLYLLFWMLLKKQMYKKMCNACVFSPYLTINKRHHPKKNLQTILENTRWPVLEGHLCPKANYSRRPVTEQT